MCFTKQVEQSFKMAIFMVETKSTYASIEILAKPVRANKYILIEVLSILSGGFFKTVG